MSSLRKFGKDTFIYSFGNLFIRFISFTLVPVYTNIFSRHEFGTYSLIFTFIGFIQIIYNYGMASVLMKFYSNDPDKKSTVITTAFISLFVTSIIFSLFLIIFATPLSSILFSESRPDWFWYIAGILFLDTISVRALIIIRFENRPVLFTSIALANVFVSLGANIVLVYQYQMGITGAIIATLMASIASFLLTLHVVIKNLDFSKYSFVLFKKMMSFGLPFLPAAIFQIIMDLADRYLIDWILGREMVGLYNAGYKIGSLMLILTTGFNLGWQPYFMTKEKDRDAPELFARIALYVLTMFITMWIVFILFGEYFIKFSVSGFSLIGPEFQASAPIIPIVMSGYIFLLFYDLFMPGIFFKNQTRLLPLYRGIGAISNIALNLIFIPKWGIAGAAWATCLSFGFMTIPLYFKSQSLFHIPYHGKKMITVIGAGISIFAIQSYYHFDYLKGLILFVIFIGLLGVLFFSELKNKSKL